MVNANPLKGGKAHTGIVLKPKDGLKVGPTGASLAPQICKAVSDAVKSGDKDKFTMELMKYNIDVRDVADSAQFG